MSIALVGMIKNEADIVALNIKHHFAEGIDEMYLAIGDSPDGTWGIVSELATEYPINMYSDTDEVWHQTSWTNQLISYAGSDEHEWIVPCDMDEFIYAVDGRTIAEALNDCPHNKLYLHSYQHLDWETRQVVPKNLPKVVFRWSSEAQVTMGAHEVSLPGGEYGVLDLREIQFRSFEHFCRKARERSAVLDPVERARGNGWHMTRLDGFSTEQMQTEWNAIVAIPTTHDPIPTHS